MTAPLAPLDATVAWLDIATRGWGVVVVPPRYQRDVAEALAARVPGRPTIALSVEALDGDGPAGAGGGFLYVAPEVPYDGEVAIWRALNGRRDWLSDRGVWVVVLTTRQLERLATHAGDLASVARRCETVPFVPRQLSDDELVAARAELHAYYQRRFGRLDLRGFIRSEREDVSFPVEAIYQPLRGVVGVVFRAPPSDGPPGLQILSDQPVPLVDILSARRGSGPLIGMSQRPQVKSLSTLLIGPPGSGKSFFLRYCALAASSAESFVGQERPLPLYVPLAALRSVAQDIDVEQYAIDELLEAGLSAAHAVASEAIAGRVLFLLDGLDEVGDRAFTLARQVEAIAFRYCRCAVVVTSRPSGFLEIAPAGIRVDVAALDDEQLTALLRTWCELYEIERAGADAAARGRREGEQLARDVLASPAVRELARTPLLATIVAIVHRSGVRLPEHRVELYEHMTRVLVERWNQLRSQRVDAPPPVRVADAIRLLGPVALRLVQQGRDAAVDEDALRSLLQVELGRGSVRTFESADGAIATFRDSLGLLVEHSPRVYGFLHKTLGEFFAAHELLRTSELERLLASGEAFDSRWHEVILLALGLVGTVYANDRRLASCVEASVVAARQRRPASGDDVPTLLGAVLTDDPDLTTELAKTIIGELVPTWWFDALPAALFPLQRAIDGRSRWGRALRDRMLGCYARGLRVPIRNADEAARLFEVYYTLVSLALPVRAPAWLYEWAVRLAVLPWGDGGPGEGWHVLEFTGTQVGDDGTISVLAGDIAAHVVASLAVIGACRLYRLDFSNHTFHAVHPGGVVTTPDTLRREESNCFFAMEPAPLPQRAALLPTILQLWREIAARDPDGPEPPASVEEAYAIYGPRPRDEAQPQRA